MNIAGLDKAAVLAALYNGSRQQGKGFLNGAGYLPMTVDQAREEIDARGKDLYFDYLHGRVMKINLSGDEVDTALYNRDNGYMAAEKIIENLRSPLENGFGEENECA